MATKTMNTVIMLFAVCLISISTTGCAFGDRNCSLQYKQTNTNIPKVGEGQTIGVLKFADNRQIKEIGEVRNGFMMKTAKVFPKGETELGGWVSNAMSVELEARGFQVNKYDQGTIPNEAKVISGALSECYTEVGFFGCKTTVRLSFNVQKKGISVMDKEYTETNSGGVAFAMADEYANAAEAALKKVMEKALPDILTAMNQ
jgi:hypothetical protein